MKKLNVYKTVKELPYKTNIISSKWIFKYKKDSEGRITKRKARLVARGFSQKYGIDFKETFSPNLKHDSLRIFTAFAAQKIFKREQIDINAAYLNANLTEEVYMKPPEGHLDYNNKFWKLNKTIYGLKQSGREQNKEINNFLINLGFKQLLSEPCFYIKRNNQNSINCILGVYVDDILIVGKSKEINNTKNRIKNKFKIKEIGDVDFVIGIKFIKY